MSGRRGDDKEERIMSLGEKKIRKITQTQTMLAGSPFAVLFFCLFVFFLFFLVPTDL